MLNRRFTRREKLLLLLLALIGVMGLYFYLVHYPVTSELAEIDAQRADVADQYAIAQCWSASYKSMREELDEIAKMPEGSVTVMPDYDNSQALIRYFDTIFAGVSPELDYSARELGGGVYERTVRFSFYAWDYGDAREILSDLLSTGWRCQMTEVSLVPEEGDLETDLLRVTGTIVFYERG